MSINCQHYKYSENFTILLIWDLEEALAKDSVRDLGKDMVEVVDMDMGGELELAEGNFPDFPASNSFSLDSTSSFG